MTESRNIEMKCLQLAGWNTRDIAEKFSLNVGHVSRILRDTSFDGDPQDAAKLQHLKDAATYAKSRLRTDLRSEGLIQEAAEIAATSIKPFKPVPTPKFKPRKKAIQETLVLVLSDGHHDQVVRSEEVGGLEHYNFPISCRRGQSLVDSTIKYAKQTLVGYDFKRLVVLSLGDNTSGSIHEAERRSAFGSMFKNSFAIGALHALMLRDLSAHFPVVDVFAVAGNHGRLTHTKEYGANGPHNNWDYAINKVAQSLCHDLSNVSFNLPNSWDSVVDVEGYGFHISHGDDVASTGGNPWTGLAKRHNRQSGIHRGKDSRQSFRDARPVDYAVIGHHHTEGFTTGNGVGFICNGAWLGTDQYAYQKMGVAGTPSQWIFGVHKDHGATWRLPVQIATQDDLEHCRYDGIIDSVDGVEYCLNAPSDQRTE